VWVCVCVLFVRDFACANLRRRRRKNTRENAKIEEEKSACKLEEEKNTQEIDVLFYLCVFVAHSLCLDFQKRVHDTEIVHSE